MMSSLLGWGSSASLDLSPRSLHFSGQERPCQARTGKSPYSQRPGAARSGQDLQGFPGARSRIGGCSGGGPHPNRGILAVEREAIRQIILAAKRAVCLSLKRMPVLVVVALSLAGCHETSEGEMVAYCRSHGGVRSLDDEGSPRVICIDGTVKAWSE